MAESRVRSIRRESEMKLVRCPYCVEGGGFKEMSATDQSGWHICGRCGHLVLVRNPEFVCTCSRCLSLKIH
jgi:hypothetical protein